MSADVKINHQYITEFKVIEPTFPKSLIPFFYEIGDGVQLRYGKPQADFIRKALEGADAVAFERVTLKNGKDMILVEFREPIVCEDSLMPFELKTLWVEDCCVNFNILDLEDLIQKLTSHNVSKLAKLELILNEIEKHSGDVSKQRYISAVLSDLQDIKEGKRYE